MIRISYYEVKKIIEIIESLIQEVVKVLQVIDRLEVGGAERVAIDLTNLLYDASLDISFLILLDKANQDVLLNKNIPRFYLKRKSKFGIKYAFKLSKILHNYDIIHVHMRHTFRYVQLVAKLFYLKTKIILHDHSSDKDKVPLFLDNFLKPTYYIGVSEDSVKWCFNKLKVKKNVFLLHNIVIRKKYNRNPSRSGLVYVSNIKPVKNQLFAIELAKYLDEDLTIVGRIQDNNYFNEVQNKILSLGIQDKVFFIHNDDNPQKRINNFNFGLMTSISESGPLVLIEYLAQSLPFVSYNTGEVSTILSNKIPESFVNSFDLALWKSKIDSLSENKIDFENLYDSYFSPNNYSKKCIAIYKQILKNS